MCSSHSRSWFLTIVFLSLLRWVELDFVLVSAPRRIGNCCRPRYLSGSQTVTNASKSIPRHAELLKVYEHRVNNTDIELAVVI